MQKNKMKRPSINTHDNLYQTFFNKQIDYLLSCQLENGSIPEKADSYTDPWNHIECCLALLSAKKIRQARRGLFWLKSKQNLDGSWFTHYDTVSKKESDYLHKQSHYAAYIAVFIWYDFFITKDKAFLEKQFPMLKKALQFSLSCQSETGFFYWAKNTLNQYDKHFLLTANANIYISLLCAYDLATILNKNEKGIYFKAFQQLKRSFNDDYARIEPVPLDFSMDWFYPVLCGLKEHDQARLHIKTYWDTFVKENLGCLCREKEPWVTYAETSELIISLCMINQYDKAQLLLDKILLQADKDHLFWMGYQYHEHCFWPLEKPTWTAAAISLAIQHLINPDYACFKQIIQNISLESYVENATVK